MTGLAYLNIFLVVVIIVALKLRAVGKENNGAAFGGFLVIVLMLSSFAMSLGVLGAWQ